MSNSIEITTTALYHDNSIKCRGDEQPCAICGRPCKNPKYYLWIHHGGSHAVTKDEGERLNSTGSCGADLGCHPIGADCLKRNPQLKPFVMD